MPPIMVQTPDFIKLQGKLQSFVKQMKFPYQVGRREMVRIIAGNLDGRRKLMDILNLVGANII